MPRPGQVNRAGFLFTACLLVLAQFPHIGLGPAGGTGKWVDADVEHFGRAQRNWQQRRALWRYSQAQQAFESMAGARASFERYQCGNNGENTAENIEWIFQEDEAKALMRYKHP